jgi:hypothetical protein
MQRWTRMAERGGGQTRPPEAMVTRPVCQMRLWPGAVLEAPLTWMVGEGRRRSRLRIPLRPGHTMALTNSSRRDPCVTLQQKLQILIGHRMRDGTRRGRLPRGEVRAT